MSESLPEAILFDLDNTLADRAAAIRHVAGLFYGSHPQLHAAYGREEVVDAYVRGDRDGYRTKREMFESIDALWPELNLVFDEFFSVYETETLGAYSPDTNVTGLIDEIEARGMPWGIVTNGSPRQHRKIRRMGLEGRTSCVVVSEEFGHSKPEPEIFLEALRLVGQPDPARVIFVGDNPEADIVGTKELGMRTAWVHRGRDWPPRLAPPDHVIGHVGELRRLLFT